MRASSVECEQPIASRSALHEAECAECREEKVHYEVVSRFVLSNQTWRADEVALATGVPYARVVRFLREGMIRPEEILRCHRCKKALCESEIRLNTRDGVSHCHGCAYVEADNPVAFLFRPIHLWGLR